MIKPNLLIVGNFHSHPSANAFLGKFLKIVHPLSSKVVSVSGDLPSDYRNKVLWVKTIPTIDTKWRILNISFYFVNQLISVSVILYLFSSRKLDLVVFLAPAPLPLIVSKLLKRKIIRYQGGSYSKQTFGNNRSFKRKLFAIMFEDFPYHLSDRIIIESKSCLEFQDLTRYSSKVRIGSLFVDSQIFYCKKSYEDRDNIIGYIGEIGMNKGVDRFANAMVLSKEFLYKNNYKIMIVGDGKLKNDIINIFKISDILDRIIFVHWIPHEEVANYLSELKLIVVPSNSEGLPNIILEAMACGTPVLANSVGAIPDIIEDSNNGFIMNNNTENSIAENTVRALRYLYIDKIIINAHNFVEENYSYEASLKRYELLFRELEK